MSATAATLRVVTTRYEGDDFPEAEEGWPQFLADRLGETYGCDVEVEYGSKTRVFPADHPAAEEIVSLVEVDLWDDFAGSFSADGAAE